MILSIEDINEMAVAVCKSSNGTETARVGYLYFSLDVMVMMIAVTKNFGVRKTLKGPRIIVPLSLNVYSMTFVSRTCK